MSEIYTTLYTYLDTFWTLNKNDPFCKYNTTCVQYREEFEEFLDQKFPEIKLHENKKILHFLFLGDYFNPLSRPIFELRKLIFYSLADEENNQFGRLNERLKRFNFLYSYNITDRYLIGCAVETIQFFIKPLPEYLNNTCKNIMKDLQKVPNFPSYQSLLEIKRCNSSFDIKNESFCEYIEEHFYAGITYTGNIGVALLKTIRNLIF